MIEWLPAYAVYDFCRAITVPHTHTHTRVWAAPDDSYSWRRRSARFSWCLFLILSSFHTMRCKCIVSNVFKCSRLAYVGLAQLQPQTPSHTHHRIIISIQHAAEKWEKYKIKCNIWCACDLLLFEMTHGKSSINNTLFRTRCLYNFINSDGKRCSDAEKEINWKTL